MHGYLCSNICFRSYASFDSVSYGRHDGQDGTETQNAGDIFIYPNRLVFT